MPKVDVVVPCYNYGRFLPACVRSVLEQSVNDVRVLIIDDASPDGSRFVAAALAKADPRISVIAHDRNEGHIRTYNEGISWASADYFLLLSADDLLVPGALRRAVDIMDDNPDVVLTHGEGIAWHDDEPLPVIAPNPGYTWSRHNLMNAICATATNLVATPTAIGRTRVQRAIGGYKESLPHSGDMEMWLRFAACGAVARIDAVQAIYRKHASAMSNAYFARMLSDYRQREQAFDSFFGEYADRLANAGALQSQARRTMANQALRCGLGLVRRGHLNDGGQLIRAGIAGRLRGFSSNSRPAAPSVPDMRRSASNAALPDRSLPELAEAIAAAEAPHPSRRH
jgi:hypothetical protein